MTPTLLNDVLEAYASADPTRKKQAFGDLIKAIKAAIKSGDVDAAACAVRKAFSPDLDYASALSLHRLYKNLTAARHGEPLKLAVLGSFTTSQLIAMIEMSLYSSGVIVEVYEGDYGVFRQEIIDATSELYEFRPDVLLLATSWRDIGAQPDITTDRAALEQQVEQELSAWLTLWQTAHERLGCQIIQNNFDAPAWRQLGNYEMRHPAASHRFIATLNQTLQDRAPRFVTVHDIDYLSSSIGRRYWSDERFFHHAKIPCNPECLVEYGHSIASLIAATKGLSKKCLALDLDNTLWGGVIGDDGLGGIRLGQGDPEGEAFVAFQRYLKSLKDRGVILAVCSKNEEANAKEAFEQHREMVLRLDDISCFKANWEPKADNLRQIATELNIGIDSIVFVDDNPAERALVRRFVPEVTVPDLSDDPSSYIQSIERLRCFQLVALSSEDFQRTQFYRANAERQTQEASATNIDEFLESLCMVARIAPIDASTLDRSTQLINKSNQFNLTTRRRTSAEILSMLNDPTWITRTVSLRDRFGDNGLISVLLANIIDKQLVIDTWLMSCRVLKRGVECLLLNKLVEIAQQHGIKSIVGEYIPTAKNVIVKDHYDKLGLTKIADDDGHTRWLLPLEGPMSPLRVFISEEDSP